MKKKTFERAFNWFYNKAKHSKNCNSVMLWGKQELLNNFKENFKKCSIVTIQLPFETLFNSWSFENDDWGVVKKHEATKLVFRIHLKKNGGRKKLIHRSFVKINWNKHL